MTSAAGDRRALRSLAAACVAAVIAVLVTVGGSVGGRAYAHDRLEGSSPSADTTARDAPTELVLRFDAAPRAVLVTAVDARGESVDLGESTREGAVARVAWPRSSDVGRYLVSWRIVSSDGHAVRGGFGFRIDPRASSSADQSRDAEGDDGLGRATLGLAIGGLVIGGLAVGGLVLRGRRRRAR